MLQFVGPTILVRVTKSSICLYDASHIWHYVFVTKTDEFFTTSLVGALHLDIPVRVGQLSEGKRGLSKEVVDYYCPS